MDSNSDKEGKKINITTKLITLSLKKALKRWKKKIFFEKSFPFKTFN